MRPYVILIVTALAIITLFSSTCHGAAKCDQRCVRGGCANGCCVKGCKDPRYRVKNCQCVPRCGGHCLDCIAYRVCRNCWKGYRLTSVIPGERICKRQKSSTPVCDPNCQTGVGCSTTGTCNGPCKAGFVLTASKTCAACDIYCDLVVGCDIRGPFLCDGNCTLGYGQTSTYNCSACDPNCATLGDTSLATGCNVYNATKCDDVCKANYIIDQTTHYCSACDSKCTATIPGSCTIPGTCNSGCDTGFAYNNVTKQCQACDPLCAGGCNLSGPGKCDQNCSSSAVFDSQTNTCLACDVNCAGGCSTPGTCSGLCKPGFGKTSDGSNRCANCDPQCTLSSGCNVQGAGYCDSECQLGYALQSYTCLGCQGEPWCSSNTNCTLTGSGTCGSTDCINNYVFDSGSNTCI